MAHYTTYKSPRHWTPERAIQRKLYALSLHRAGFKLQQIAALCGGISSSMAGTLVRCGQHHEQRMTAWANGSWRRAADEHEVVWTPELQALEHRP